MQYAVWPILFLLPGDEDYNGKVKRKNYHSQGHMDETYLCLYRF